ncbi:hypothetical protein GCM10010988_30460 [Cnuibacter physcomitrellae]|uniref:Uncharacterized protein n=1 Tax=Cnuibacter physcomitrellae TaxID=1619308 RepID=A0A1X9LJ15_9MICO|nr:hypothetical protein [Cnuibacter physcomitrellae]ARJ04298.1 hypothetical protein B5808_02925 [Cnuibacter physcomitrellae]GGI40712.1 hypothetical protein GCM10010988_30460 [Cnuibacter physcomitrellae]
MTLPALRDDALTVDGADVVVRLSLPWIRSLPLSSVLDLALSIDGAPVDDLLVDLGGRLIAPGELAQETRWWFLQDRLVLRASTILPEGVHDVLVTFRLAIPYLPAGPDAPLTLPFEVRCELTARPETSHARASEVSRDVL